MAAVPCRDRQERPVRAVSPHRPAARTWVARCGRGSDDARRRTGTGGGEPVCSERWWALSWRWWQSGGWAGAGKGRSGRSSEVGSSGDGSVDGGEPAVENACRLRGGLGRPWGWQLASRCGGESVGQGWPEREGRAQGPKRPSRREVTDNGIACAPHGRGSKGLLSARSGDLVVVRPDEAQGHGWALRPCWSANACYADGARESRTYALWLFL